MAPVQFPEPPGPPGGSDGLQGSLVVQPVLPIDDHIDCLLLSLVFWNLQALRKQRNSQICGFGTASVYTSETVRDTFR